MDVLICRLCSSACGRFRKRRPHVLKIDVEGHDYEVPYTIYLSVSLSQFNFRMSVEGVDELHGRHCEGV